MYVAIFPTMSTATSKQVLKLTKKAKAVVEERQVSLNKQLNSNADNADERETPFKEASTRPSTKCKNANSGDAVGKKAQKTTNVDKHASMDKECTCDSS